MSIKRSGKGNGLIFFSFIIAFVLTALPLPDWAMNGRPHLLALVLIYWCIAMPERVGLFVAWCVGLILDVQEGMILGQNALGFVLIAYMSIKVHKRMRVYPLVQQSVLIGLYLLVYQLLMLMIMGYFGSIPQNWTYWMSAITSMLLWPWLFRILRSLRRKYHIS